MSRDARRKDAPRVRLGIVSYLNARPLTDGVEEAGGEPRFEPHFDIPSVVARRLADGETDLALIPSIEYARIPGLSIVPGIAIASFGPVRSVLLVSRRPPAETRSIALDSGSRASEGLLRILTRAVFGTTPGYERMPPDLDGMLRHHDGALLIGDAALHAKTDGLVVTDLGDAWTRHTGLPFVFAFWAGPASRIPAGTGAALRDLRRRGLARIEGIAREHAGGDPGREAEAASYLRESIRYDLGAEEIEGLERYYALARECGLIPEIPGIRFLPEEGSA